MYIKIKDDYHNIGKAMDILQANDIDFEKINAVLVLDDGKLNKELYKSLSLSHYIYAEIEDFLKDEHISDEEKEKMFTEISAELSLSFNPEVEKYLKSSIKTIIKRINHNQKEV